MTKHGAINKVRIDYREATDEDPETGDPIKVQVPVEIYENTRNYQRLDSSGYLVKALDLPSTRAPARSPRPTSSPSASSAPASSTPTR